MDVIEVPIIHRIHYNHLYIPMARKIPELNAELTEWLREYSSWYGVDFAREVIMFKKANEALLFKLTWM